MYPLAAQKLRVDSYNEDFFVVRTVENTDTTPLRQALVCPPKKIVVKFFRAWMLEAKDLTSLGVDARHDVLDGSIFASSIHSLKNQKQRNGVVRIEELLERLEFFDLVVENFVIFAFAIVEGFYKGRPFDQIDLFAFSNAKIFFFKSHGYVLRVATHISCKINLPLDRLCSQRCICCEYRWLRIASHD